jgi:hypothetical protein
MLARPDRFSGQIRGIEKYEINEKVAVEKGSLFSGLQTELEQLS